MTGCHSWPSSALPYSRPEAREIGHSIRAQDAPLSVLPRFPSSEYPKLHWMTKVCFLEPELQSAVRVAMPKSVLAGPDLRIEVEDEAPAACATRSKRCLNDCWEE